MRKINKSIINIKIINLNKFEILLLFFSKFSFFLLFLLFLLRSYLMEMEIQTRNNRISNMRMQYCVMAIVCRHWMFDQCIAGFHDSVNYCCTCGYSTMNTQYRMQYVHNCQSLWQRRHSSHLDVIDLTAAPTLNRLIASYYIQSSILQQTIGLPIKCIGHFSSHDLIQILKAFEKCNISVRHEFTCIE